MSTNLRTNPYSGEAKVRQDLMDVLVEADYGDVAYSLADRDGKRTLTLKAVKELDDGQQSLNFNLNPEAHPDDV